MLIIDPTSISGGWESTCWFSIILFVPEVRIKKLWRTIFVWHKPQIEAASEIVRIGTVQEQLVLRHRREVRAEVEVSNKQHI